MHYSLSIPEMQYTTSDTCKFNSEFQRIQSMVSGSHSKNGMAENHDRGKMFTAWWPRSKKRKEEPLMRSHPSKSDATSKCETLRGYFTSRL